MIEKPTPVEGGVQPSEFGDALDHLRRLQTQVSNLNSAAMVLVASIVLFIAIGASAWQSSWQFILGIVGVLLIHELGHYVAMQIFNYRNVRMFFIPLMGAAVAGQHLRAPGWKRVVVALAGPLPGILIGAVVGIIGMREEQTLLVQAGLLLVGLNGLQLLPILPLDGGQVLQAILFSRHYLLELTFRFVAAVLLIVLGLALGTYIIAGLGAFLLLGLYSENVIARTAHDLRSSDLPLDTTDATEIDGQQQRNLIPTYTATRIMQAVVDRVPVMGKDPKTLAILTQRIFESLATRTPSVLASLGFALLHLGSFVAAVFFILLLSMDGSNWLNSYVYGPTRGLEPTEIRVLEAEHSTETGVTLITHFDWFDQAEQYYDNLQPDAESDVRAVLFGMSVLQRFPTEQRASAALLDIPEEVDDAFVLPIDAPGTLILQFTLPDEPAGDEVLTALQHSVGMDYLDLIPAWVGELDPRTEAERSAHKQARGTIRSLQLAGSEPTDEMKALSDESTTALLDQEMVRFVEINEEIAALRHTHRTAARKKLLDELPADQRPLGDTFMRLAEASEDAHPDGEGFANEEVRARWQAELGPPLGAWPRDEAAIPLSLRRIRAEAGWVFPKERVVEIGLDFREPAYALPQLVQWLDDQGCRLFRYDIYLTE